MSSSPNQLDLVLQQFQQQLLRMDRQLLKTRQSVAALQAESVLRAQGRAPRFPIEFTSQFGEDLLAWLLFGDQTTGFFIEAGAFDGYHHSVTYPFEAIGWHGLLVEPTPDRFQQCLARRPHSRVVNSALSRRDSQGVTDHWIVQDQYGGVLSYSKPTPEHLQAIGNATRSRVSVQLTTLDDLLADHHSEIDLCVIDVEGAELDVLDGFDLTRFKPRVLMIEDNSRGQDVALAAFMQRQPYTSIGRLAVNNIYVRSDQSDMLDRFRWSQL